MSQLHHAAWDHEVVLPLLRACQTPSTLAEIEARTDLPRDTLRAQLHSLEGGRLIARFPDNGLRHELTVAGRARLVILSRYGQQAA